MIHRDPKQISMETLRHHLAGKELYLWGAGNQGRGMARVLIENNIIPAGYIDSSPEMAGQSLTQIKVETPDILTKKVKEKIFIIISAFFYEQEIASTCNRYGLTKGSDFIHYSQLKFRDYSIDISGICNLNCLSCPRASKRKDAPASGMMSLENFKQVITKIRREDPFVGNIQLYQWGEPTLNKELPEMIDYAREHNILSAISSNLNTNVDYQRIIESKPEWFRVSASGWGKDYEIAHTGGKWDTFLYNFRKLSELRRVYHPEMKLELYYHLYSHSVGAGFKKFRNFCKEMSVEFHPVYAYLISLDDVLRYQEGEPLPSSANRIMKHMIFDVAKGLAIAKKESDMPCDAFRSIHINSDLSVSNCMMFFYPKGNRAVLNFLEHDINTIMEKRHNCDICKRCLKHSMHRYCSAYSTLATDMTG